MSSYKHTEIQFFVVDLDRTLDGEHEACRSALEALRQDTLVRAALATAHGAWTPKALAVGSYYGLDYLILENGSVILERDGDGWRELPAWGELHGNAYAEAARFREGLLERVRTEDAVSLAGPRHFFRRRDVALLDTGARIELQEMSRVTILSAYDEDSFVDLKRLVESICGELRGEVVLVWDERAVTVGVADKGDAMVFLAGYGVPQRLRTAAMGDSFNDLGMLSRCDVPCTPANGYEPVKALVRQRGGIVAQTERWRGVEEVLRQLRRAAGGF